MSTAKSNRDRNNSASPVNYCLGVRKCLPTFLERGCVPRRVFWLLHAQSASGQQTATCLASGGLHRHGHDYRRSHRSCASERVKAGVARDAVCAESDGFLHHDFSAACRASSDTAAHAIASTKCSVSAAPAGGRPASCTVDAERSKLQAWIQRQGLRDGVSCAVRRLEEAG